MVLVAPEAAMASAEGTGAGRSGSLRSRWAMPAEPGSSPGAEQPAAPDRLPSRHSPAKPTSPAPMGLRERERGFWIAYG
jgi:hypothetical protein